MSAGISFEVALGVGQRHTSFLLIFLFVFFPEPEQRLDRRFRTKRDPGAGAVARSAAGECDGSVEAKNLSPSEVGKSLHEMSVGIGVRHGPQL
jgi:hypothetical protein